MPSVPISSVKPIVRIDTLTKSIMPLVPVLSLDLSLPFMFFYSAIGDRGGTVRTLGIVTDGHPTSRTIGC